MKEIVLQSDFPCLVVTENEEVFMSPTDKLSVDECEIYIYPISCRNHLPFKIDFTRKVSKNYRILEENGKLLCFLFAPTTLSKKIIEKQKIGQTNIAIKISSTEIKFESDSEELSLPLDFSPKEYSCHEIENFSCLLIKNKNNERLFIYNPSSHYFKIYNGYDFKFEKSKVSFTQVFCDVASSKINKILSFEKNKVEEKTEDVNFSNYYVSSSTICYAFLDCICQENFLLAKKFLSENFSETTQEQFQDFFGKFYKFFPLSENRFLLILNGENKIVQFKIENNKISDFYLE